MSGTTPDPWPWITERVERTPPAIVLLAMANDIIKAAHFKDAEWDRIARDWLGLNEQFTQIRDKMMAPDTGTPPVVQEYEHDLEVTGEPDEG